MKKKKKPMTKGKTGLYIRIDKAEKKRLNAIRKKNKSTWEFMLLHGWHFSTINDLTRA